MAIDRRDFVTRASALAAMGMVSAPVLAAAEAGGDPIADWIVVNALGGLGDPNSPPDGTRSAISQRVLADAHASGVTAINITLGYVAGPEEPFEDTVRDIATTDRMIRDNPRDLIKILSAADIRRAKAEKKVGLLYGFQNCAMLGKDATRVDVFADLGVRVFQLTYNPANLLGDGSMAPENRGLTPFGREVIARLNDRRVMVDLSHSGERTCLDAARASRAPISINHTGCRALTDLPRNKTDAELRLVAERGGFVGIYFMPFLNQSGHATAEDVVAHIDHAVNLCGEDHVGIGTDGTVTQIDDLKVYEAKLAKEIADRRAAGISATGERPDTYPFVVDLRGPDQFRKLARLLEAKGYSPRRVEKILGLNFLRYAETIWGG
ncbi:MULTISPECIES: membrane dipeptidase [unclassified Sphingomonas]|uniref:dipeptidase n=1 Tax=unclassified Sphingomonas TaxID=196159 RepID=UPI00092B4B8C|nr:MULTISPECIES: membrane dipeptidase [unclassified Sphingomonas]OJU17371.1 MAG: peptidase M19 [Sphingomonas sp. 66-10]